MVEKENDNKQLRNNGGNRSYWRKWYIGVFLFLLLQITFYYFITAYFK